MCFCYLRRSFFTSIEGEGLHPPSVHNVPPPCFYSSSVRTNLDKHKLLRGSLAFLAKHTPGRVLKK